MIHELQNGFIDLDDFPDDYSEAKTVVRGDKNYIYNSEVVCTTPMTHVEEQRRNTHNVRRLLTPRRI